MSNCHPWKGRRAGPWCSCRHGRMMSSFNEAAEAWADRAEAASNGHATEMAEFKQEHPMPQLGDWMKGFEG